MGSYRIVSFLVPFFLATLCFLVQFSLAVDTIIPGKSLRTNETLVSQGETFVLGFFNTSIPHKLYLGIWYYKIPIQTIVWVGNREAPLTDSSGSLQITNNGTLVLLNGEGTSIWSVNVPKVATNPTAKLLDSGNLIIIEAQDSVDNGNFLWQSFDYPTHTLLPGMKIGIDLKTGQNRILTSWKTADDPARGDFSYRLDHRGSPQFYIYSNSTPIYRTGPWIGKKFSGTPELALESIFNFSFIDNQDESYYIYSVIRKDIISRLAIMADTGTMIRYKWSNEDQAWLQLWRNPRDDCDNYEFCPAFANCNSNNQPYCNCLQGFGPRSIDQWNLRNFSGGCQRRAKLACGNGDGFLVIQNIKFPDTSMAQVEEGLSLVDCGAKCLSNCNCSGYGKTNVNGRDGCLIWYGDLVDLREFSDIDQQFYVRVAASEVNQTSGGNLGRKNPKTRERFIVIGAVTVVSVALLLTLCIWYWWKRKKKEKPIIKVQEGSKKGQEALLLELRTGINKGAKEIPYLNKVGESRNADSGVWFLELDDVIAATDNFSNANKVGQGGFGPVYKGHLPDGQEIAVKRLLTGSSQGLEEFKNEILLISKLQHKNLVRLLGCCVEQEEKILIYEYMTNKSLDHFIFDSDKSSLLDWGIRLNIMVGIARGLLYLHRDSRLRIIHRDLKASNVLLDDKMNPKIADFGMARIFGGDQTQAITCKVAGTHGYMSPEYLIDGRFSEKSDVFSFGVLILEIISGKRNREFYNSDHPLTLVEHVWNLWNEDRGLELVDPSMGDSYSTSQVLRFIHVGLLCVQEWAVDRPTMPSIFFMMSSESMALPQPKEPAFYKRRPTSETESSSNKRGTWSNCEITVSLEEGR